MKEWDEWLKKLKSKVKWLLWGTKKRQTQSVHYIGGSDVLPPPLTREEEEKLMQQLMMFEGDEQKLKEVKSILIEHNLRLVVYIARKFENTGIHMEDLISIGTIGLIKSINTFNLLTGIKCINGFY